MSTLVADLEHVLAETRPLWEEWRGKRFFLTGGTGFFGAWLLHSFHFANERLGLGAQAVVLSRDPEAFARKMPELAASPAIRFLRGDVLTLPEPDQSFDFCIHAATPADAKMMEHEPLLMLDTIVTGTRKVLDFAAKAGVKKFLLTSSGAVYGRQPLTVSHVDEDYPGAPDLFQTKSSYGEGKRMAEHVAFLHARQSGMEAKVARCFAFVGPYLPIDGHYAVGNFIRDGLRGGPIRVGGDGTPLRSYLYAADLAVWLWTLLGRGRAGCAYNVGSEESLSIREIAEKTAACFGSAALPVEIASPVVSPESARAPERYVPSTRRVREELGLKQSIPFEQALARTVAWHRSR